MAHGLSGTRDASLEPYAKRFADAGFYVVLFDYRYLGASDGEPRQLVSIPRQLEDWKSAIAFARTLPGVDADRIGLWGCSLSGGHVIVAAARDKRIAAVSAQCPMLDGHASARKVRKQVGFGKIVRLAAASIYDSVRAAFGLSPYYVPLVAPAGEVAAMPTADAYAGLKAIVPPGWRNQVAARIFLRLPFYRPIRYARDSAVPRNAHRVRERHRGVDRGCHQGRRAHRQQGTADDPPDRPLRHLSGRMVRAVEQRTARLLQGGPAGRVKRSVKAINSHLGDIHSRAGNLVCRAR